MRTRIAGGLFVSHLRSETDLKSHNKKRKPFRFSLDVSFSSPTTVDKHTKISSEEISDGREYSLLFLYVKVVVSCKVVGLYGARRRLTNWQDTLF